MDELESLDITLHCSSDLIDRCKALQDIFYYGDSQRRHDAEIVQMTQDGYLIRFKRLKSEPFTVAAQESRTEDDTLTMLPNSEAVEQLNMMEGPPILATHTSNDEISEENTAVVPLSGNEANARDEAEENSVNNVSSERSTGTTGEPIASNVESKPILTFGYLSEMNTIREANEPKHVQIQDSYSSRNNSRHIRRIVSNIDDGDREDTSTKSQQTVSTISTGTAQIVQDMSREGLQEFVQRNEITHPTQHALHHCVHKEEKCPYYNDFTECERNLSIKGMKCIHIYLEGSREVKYDEDIIVHLWSKMCRPPVCPLWKFYIQNEMYITYEFALQLADEGLLIYSGIDEDKVGTIRKQYIDFDKVKKEKIGSGGFGEVYRCGRIAVKEEYKKPIIKDGRIFKMVTQLKHENVISMNEYIVGRRTENKCFYLFVMPYINKRGLHKQFKTHKCIVDYMVQFPEEEDIIFNNFLILFLHVFKGLEYLHDKGIVHGDVKDANILVQQNCLCGSPLRCKCPNHDGVTYMLTDMDLLCLDGESLPSQYVEWSEMKLHEPAGTYGLKASELYFTGEKGEPCGSSKSDIWAGCVTMMKALVGKEKSEEAHEQIKLFFEAVSISGDKYASKVKDAIDGVKQLKKIVKSFDKHPEARDKAMIKLDDIQKLLKSAQFVQKTRHVSAYTYSKKFPLELILSAVHMANSLQQLCLEKLPHIYTKELWSVMTCSMEFIKDGVRFLPQKRPSATDIKTKLLTMLLHNIDV